MNRLSRLAAAFIMLTQIAGCASYTSQYVPFRPPEAYVNHQNVDGVAIGAEAYLEKDLAKEAFGFDIRETGLIPVQLVMNNLSGRTLQIVSEQTFLIDINGNYWQVIPNPVVVNRVEKSTEYAAIGKSAGKGALWGAAAGAILGAAVGIVSGENVGSAMGKGAVIGGAGGAVVGAGKEAASPQERQVQILNDIRSKGLEDKTIPIGYLANGFLFFPGEAKSVKTLKLQFRELEGGPVRNVNLDLIYKGQQ